ncbi:MAG TPA: hypothetical protein VH351_05045 [Bryobacteraceae bacterium]|jgi:hypothetical protein|nr:hypothetical protein [Bryobacteraceae bacterium]
MGGYRILDKFRSYRCTACAAAFGLLCLLAAPTAAGSQSRKLQAINSYCKELQSAFSNATPFVFAGPDPWTEIDELPAKMPDEAVAYLYTTGAEIRWVFIRIVDEQDGWSEDLNYFYRDDGTLAKRTRQVQSRAANLVLDVTSYFEEGKLLKESHKHHALASGKQDTSQFVDPDAPVYWTTDDLPFPEILDLWQRLA